MLPNVWVGCICLFLSRSAKKQPRNIVGKRREVNGSTWLVLSVVLTLMCPLMTFLTPDSSQCWLLVAESKNSFPKGK